MEQNPGMIELNREEPGREIMRTPDEVTAIFEITSFVSRRGQIRVSLDTSP